MLPDSTSNGATASRFFVMWDAFLYMPAASSPHQMERGKSAIVNAVAAFSIVLMASVIAGMIQDSIGAWQAALAAEPTRAPEAGRSPPDKSKSGS